MWRRAFVGLLCLFLLQNGSVTRADSFEWDGGAGDDLWNGIVTDPNLDTNWSINEFPDNDDDIVLTAASLDGPQTIDLNGPREINGISANGVDGTYTFENNGAGALTIVKGSGEAVITRTDGSFVFENDLLLNSADTLRLNVQADGGKITVNGDIASSALSGTTVLMPTVVNTSLPVGVEINGVISDGTAQTALSSGFNGNLLHLGTVRITGLNTYTGSTRVNIGTLEIDSIADIGGAPNALGQPLAANSTIQLGTSAGNSGVNTATLRYLGAGHSSDRQIELAGRDNDTAVIESSGTGALMLTGGVINPANGETLALGGSNLNENTLGGSIAEGNGSDLTSLRKQGTGRWILSGNSPALDGPITVNEGELEVTGTLGTALANTGRLQVDTAGTLTLNGGAMNVSDFNNIASGTFNFQAGTLRIANGTSAGGSGSFSIGTAGAGTLQLDGGSGDFGDVTLEGADDTVSINNGTWSFERLDNTQGGMVNFSGGTLELTDSTAGQGLITGAGTIDSTLTGVGEVTKIGTGTLTVNSNGTNSGKTNINAGVLEVSPAARLSDGTTVNVASGATLKLLTSSADAIFGLEGNGNVELGDATLIIGNSLGPGASGGVGTFSGTLTDGPGPAVGDFEKRGSGDFIFAGTATHTGRTEVENGALLVTGTISDTSQVDIVDGPLSGAGAFILDGGTIVSAGAVNADAVGALLRIDSGSLTATRIDVESGSTYRTFIWNMGSIRLTGPNGVDVGVAASADQPFQDDLDLIAGKSLTVDNNNTQVGSDGTLSLSGGTLTTPELVVDSGGVFEFNSGTLAFSQDAIIDSAFVDRADVAGLIQNGRTLEVMGQATIETPLVLAGGTLRFGTVVNPGTLILDSGTLEVAGGDLTIATGEIVDVTSGMTVTVTDGALNIADGGEFNSINATLQLNDGITNSGALNLINTDVLGSVVSAVGSGSTLVGTNSVSGDYAMSDGDSLLIDLGGTAVDEFDTLSIGGDGTLNGSLSVSLDPSFSLTVGDAFEIVNIDGSQSGMFAGLTDGALVGNFGGVDLFIDYDGGDGNDVVLFTASGADVDLDGDGDVDGSDFLALQRTNPSLLSDWANQYGSGSGALTAGQAVPEPSTLLMLALTLAATCTRRPARRR